MFKFYDPTRCVALVTRLQVSLSLSRFVVLLF